MPNERGIQHHMSRSTSSQGLEGLRNAIREIDKVAQSQPKNDSGWNTLLEKTVKVVYALDAILPRKRPEREREYEVIRSLLEKFIKAVARVLDICVVASAKGNSDRTALHRDSTIAGVQSMCFKGLDMICFGKWASIHCLREENFVAFYINAMKDTRLLPNMCGLLWDYSEVLDVDVRRSGCLAAYFLANKVYSHEAHARAVRSNPNDSVSERVLVLDTNIPTTLVMRELMYPAQVHLLLLDLTWSMMWKAKRKPPPPLPGVKCVLPLHEDKATDAVYQGNVQIWSSVVRMVTKVTDAQGPPAGMPVDSVLIILRESLKHALKLLMADLRGKRSERYRPLDRNNWNRLQVCVMWLMSSLSSIHAQQPPQSRSAAESAEDAKILQLSISALHLIGPAFETSSAPGSSVSVAKTAVQTFTYILIATHMPGTREYCRAILLNLFSTMFSTVGGVVRFITSIMRQNRGAMASAVQRMPSSVLAELYPQLPFILDLCSDMLVLGCMLLSSVLTDRWSAPSTATEAERQAIGSLIPAVLDTCGTLSKVLLAVRWPTEPGLSSTDSDSGDLRLEPGVICSLLTACCRACMYACHTINTTDPTGTDAALHAPLVSHLLPRMCALASKAAALPDRLAMLAHTKGMAAEQTSCSVESVAYHAYEALLQCIRFSGPQVLHTLAIPAVSTAVSDITGKLVHIWRQNEVWDSDNVHAYMAVAATPVNELGGVIVGAVDTPVGVLPERPSLDIQCSGFRTSLRMPETSFEQLPGGYQVVQLCAGCVDLAAALPALDTLLWFCQQLDQGMRRRPADDPDEQRMFRIGEEQVCRMMAVLGAVRLRAMGQWQALAGGSSLVPDTRASSSTSAGPVPACFELLVCGLPVPAGWKRSGCSHVGCGNLESACEGQLRTQSCGGLCGARYCSKECQTAAWVAGHKRVCKQIRALVQRAAGTEQGANHEASDL